MSRDILHLGKFRFPVKKDEATIHGYISNATDYELVWNIRIECEGDDVVVDGETSHWEPTVYLQGMQFPFRDWRKLVGQKVRRTSKGKVEPATLYIYEHDDMETSEIHFVSRKGIWFGVDWKFVWEEYAGRVQTTVKFTEITIWLADVDTKAKARERLERDLDLDFFNEAKRRRPYPHHGPQFKFVPIP